MSRHSAKSGAFHAREGWYLARGEDGSVTIWSGEDAEVTLDASSWASVVASVSAGGESSASYRAALAFHQGG